MIWLVKIKKILECLRNVLRSSQINFTNGIYTCIDAKEFLTNAVADFTNALRMKQQQDACVIYAYTVLPVFLFYLYLPAPAQSAYSHSNFVRIPSLFYTNTSKPLQTSYDHNKCIVINKKACNLLRICCEYAFPTEFRNIYLIFAISLERLECLRIRTNVWR